MLDKTSGKRFDGLSVNFATSEVHQSSPTIERLHSLIDISEPFDMCDVACGPGHTALSFAKRAERIVGVDPAPNMLQTFHESTMLSVLVEFLFIVGVRLRLPEKKQKNVLKRCWITRLKKC